MGPEGELGIPGYGVSFFLMIFFNEFNSGALNNFKYHVRSVSRIHKHIVFQIHTFISYLIAYLKTLALSNGELFLCEFTSSCFFLQI